MKLRVILIISIALNVGLVAATAFRVATPSDRAKDKVRPSSTLQFRASSTAQSEMSERKAAAPKSNASVLNVDCADDIRTFLAEHWNDYGLLANQLTEMGFSRNIVRRVFRAMILEKYDQQLAEALYPEGLGYWEPARGLGQEAQRINNLIEHDLKLAFAFVEPEMTETQRRERWKRWGSISSEKANAVDSLKVEYQKILAEWLRPLSGSRGSEAERSVARQAAQTAMMDEIRSLLTPTEFREYELRQSDTARGLMRQLAGVALSEAEYETLFDIQEKFDTQYRYTIWDRSLQTARERTLAGVATSEALLDVLGAERGSKYLRSTDPIYAGFEQTLGGAASVKTLVAAWRVRGEAFSEAAALGANEQLNLDERAGAARRLIEDTDARMLELVGTGTQRLREWLSNNSIESGVLQLAGVR